MVKLFKSAFAISALLFLSNCAKPENVPTNSTESSDGDSSVETLFDKTFCAQTFNVYAPAYASNVNGRLNRLADEINTDTCDVIQFQELWRDNDFASFKTRMGKGRYTLNRADDLRNDKFIIGLASAIDGQILNGKSEIFEVNNDGGFMDGIRDSAGVQKGYTFLTVQTPNTPKLVLINLHTHPDKEAIRLAQMTQLIKQLIAIPSLLENPIVLTADLNARPDSSEIGLLKSLLLLRDSYLEANKSYGKLCTYCGDNPLGWDNDSRVIDFVLIKNSLETELRSKASIINLKGQPGSPLSDHFGVQSQIAWGKQMKPELTVMDPIVQSRVQAAVKALDRAIVVLQKNTAKGFRQAAQTLRTWRDNLNASKLDPAFERIFRTP